MIRKVNQISLSTNTAPSNQTVALNAFARLGTLERFGLSEGKLRSFLTDVEAHHHAKNPYHTAVHVSDVVQAVVVALRADEGWQVRP